MDWGFEYPSTKIFIITQFLQIDLFNLFSQVTESTYRRVQSFCYPSLRLSPIGI